MKDKISAWIKESIRVKEECLKGQADSIEQAARCMLGSLKKGGKIILFGNGGSAADAQHLTAELVGRFRRERDPIPAVALSVNTSILTSIANDYSYKVIFERQIEALGRPGDVAIGISTSGNAENVIEGIRCAHKKQLKTIGLTGKNGGELAKLTDIAIVVPSEETAHIQEVHITIGHLLCELVEEALADEKA